MNKLILGAASAAALFFAGNAVTMAQDASTFDWSGFYLGVNAGYGAGHIGIVTAGPGPYDGLPIDFDVSGGVVGVTVGANMQSGNLVFGIEGDLASSSIVGDADPLNFGGADAILTTHIDWLGTIRGRIGVSSGNMLFFATGGLAAGGISGVVTNFPTDGSTSSNGGTQYGYAVGAGVEVAVTEAVTLKAEYLYVDLGTTGYDLPPLVANTHPTASIVRIGLNYGF